MITVLSVCVGAIYSLFLSSIADIYWYCHFVHYRKQASTFRQFLL